MPPVARKSLACAQPTASHPSALRLMMPAPPASGGAGVPATAATGHLVLSGDALVGFTGFVAVGIGGMIGCWLRWGLGMLLNPLFPTLPLGTLAANLAGGLLMGCVMGLFDHFQTLPLALRLFVFTGFLGGLTTFSTFSA